MSVLGITKDMTLWMNFTVVFKHLWFKRGTSNPTKRSKPDEWSKPDKESPKLIKKSKLDETDFLLLSVREPLPYRLVFDILSTQLMIMFCCCCSVVTSHHNHHHEKHFLALLSYRITSTRLFFYYSFHCRDRKVIEFWLKVMMILVENKQHYVYLAAIGENRLDNYKKILLLWEW